MGKGEKNNRAGQGENEQADGRKTMYYYGRLLRYLKPHRAIFIIAMVCLVVYGATDGAIPFLIQHILDNVFAQGNKSLLTILPIILLAFAVVRGAVDFGQQYLMAKVGHLIVRDIRNDLNRHVQKLSGDYFLRNSVADLLARLNSDVIIIRTLLTDSLSSVLRDSIRVVALVIAAIYLDPTLAGIAVIGFPIGFYPIYKFGRRLRKLSRRGQEAIGTLSSRLQESVLGYRVVRGFGREQFEEERFEQENDRLTRTFVKSEGIRAVTGPINEVLAAAAVSGVILYGGYSVISGIRTQGEFLAFLVSVFLLYDPFKKLSRIHGTVQQAMAGAERIFALLDTKPTVQDCENPKLLPKKHSISFQDVSFRYDANAGLVLKNISLDVREGECVALVGFSGSGKSTLVDLVPRFIDPTSGVVRLGDVDMRELSLSDLRSQIALVSQHTFLFNDTVYNNIAYGAENADREMVEAAARAAYAESFILQLPHKYDTVVGEGGFALSGGERQRISIARAILKNAPILVLDEATASLDNRSEREVQAALETLSANRTTIVIAHRLSTVRRAHRIVVLRDGEITEIGTHDELIAHSGEYEKLYKLQFHEPGVGNELSRESTASIAE